MGDLAARDLARWRLHTQRLTGAPAEGPVEVVCHLLAVQAENHSQAAWAVAARCAPITEAQLDAALANARDFVAALKLDRAFADGPLQDLPLSVYDEIVLRDAWGSPIVFMPAKHRWVGTAPAGRYFFFSAGPDRQFLTQDDNLYSYEPAGGQ